MMKKLLYVIIANLFCILIASILRVIGVIGETIAGSSITVSFGVIFMALVIGLSGMK